jgi:hypothetical protein
MSLQDVKPTSKFDKSAYVWRPCVCCKALILQGRFEKSAYCFSCRNPFKREESEDIYSFSNDVWYLRVNKALKKFYIEQMNGDDLGWRKNILHSAHDFNVVWRTALKTVIPSIEINVSPPPKNLRKIYLFNTTVAASRSCEKTV